ncbi:hypothetical protein ACFL6S_17005 [Candidatus Poribacteria bacterium]
MDAMDFGKLTNISRAEVKRLESFVQRANELLQRRIFKEGLPKTKLSWGIPVKSGAVKSEFPDEEDFRSALLDLRMFYMNKEDTHFYSICNILYKTLADDALREYVKSTREIYQQNLENCLPLGIKVNGSEQLSGKKVLDMYFYGRYFHDKKDKRDRLGYLEDRVFPEYLKYNLISVVKQMVLCIRNLKIIIEKALEPSSDE